MARQTVIALSLTVGLAVTIAPAPPAQAAEK